MVTLTKQIFFEIDFDCEPKRVYKSGGLSELETGPSATCVAVFMDGEKLPKDFAQLVLDCLGESELENEALDIYEEIDNEQSDAC